MSTARRVLLAIAGAAVCAVAVSGVVLWQSGYRAYIVHTNSMYPTFKSGDLVIDRPTSTVHAGDVITFEHAAGSTDVVTHRVTDVRAGAIHTKGDANPTPDAWDIRPAQVQGVMVTHLPRLGFVVVFLRQPAGVASMLTASAALVLLWSLFFAPEGKPTAEPVASLGHAAAPESAAPESSASLESAAPESAALESGS